MPPRFVYWTILAGGLPTAFRAAERDELLPTFKRILEKHPDAEMKYFAQGQLWNSPEEAKAARERPPARDARGRDWRPGGTHRDPRQKFKDAKKDRNQRWRKEKHERRTEGRPTFEPRGPRKPHGDPLARQTFKPRPSGPSVRPSGPVARPSRPAARKPTFSRDGRPDRPAFKPKGDRPFKPQGERRSFKPQGERRSFKPQGERRPFKPHGERPPAKPRTPYRTKWQQEQDKKKKDGES